MPDSKEWLAQVTEEILEPARRICDPHHHLWDHPGNRYLLDELLEDVGSGHNVVSTVFVECMSMYRADGPEEMRPVGETEFVNGVAAMSASGRYGEARVCSGIISYANLALGDAVAPVLEAHIAAAPQRFRGIRHAAGWHASPEVRNSHTNPPESLLSDPEFRKGYAQLGRYGLSFEAWLYHPQIPELTALVRAFPDIPIVFDHFGGPLGVGPFAGKQDEVFSDWKPAIDELAKCPNVVAKLGGINMPLNGFGWDKRPVPPTSEELAAGTKHYYEYAIERFGPERCMFESNFPVDRASASYPVLWNTFKRIAAGYSDSEKDAMFHDTAARAYRLEGAPVPA